MQSSILIRSFHLLHVEIFCNVFLKFKKNFLSKLFATYSLEVVTFTKRMVTIVWKMMAILMRVRSSDN